MSEDKLKMILLIWMTASFVLIISACSFAPSYQPQSRETLPEGVSVRLEAPIHTPLDTAIALVLTNASSEAFTYGSRFAIEQYDSWSATWRLLPFADHAAFDAILHSVPPQGAVRIEYPLSLLKSKLKLGRCRIWALDDRSVLEFRVEQAATTG